MMDTDGTERNQVERFIAALHALEADNDLDPIVAAYAETSETSNVATPRKFAGSDGARDFWTRYRRSFGEVRSKFRHVVVGDGVAALEWTTTGTAPDGSAIAYDGVSMLEVDDDGITRFRAFFDPVNLGRQMVEDGKVTAATTPAGAR